LLKKQQNKTREFMFSDAPGVYHGAFFFVFITLDSYVLKNLELNNQGT